MRAAVFGIKHRLGRETIAVIFLVRQKSREIVRNAGGNAALFVLAEVALQSRVIGHEPGAIRERDRKLGLFFFNCELFAVLRGQRVAECRSVIKGAHGKSHLRAVLIKGERALGSAVFVMLLGARGEGIRFVHRGRFGDRFERKSHRKVNRIGDKTERRERKESLAVQKKHITRRAVFIEINAQNAAAVGRCDAL